VHHFDPENKRQSMEYRHKGSPAPETFKTAPSAGKIMLTAFWDVNGVVCSEFLPIDGTINSDRYVGTLQKLKARIPRVRPYMEQVFLRDNYARPHMSARSTAIHCLGFTVLDHPSYNPHLAPSISFRN
jgi:hypothetical protein